MYFVTVNFIAYSLFHIDKNAAKKKSFRISEKNLLLLCLFGGTIGAWLGMNHFRHKTQKTSFRWKFFLIVFIQILVVYFLFKRYR